MDELDSWTLVDGPQSREPLEDAKRREQQKCKKEFDQATRAISQLITAQGDLRSGRLKIHERDEIRRSFSVPSTEVRLQAFIWESPPVIRTATQHFFKTGQNVVITGLKLRDGAPERVGDLVESISGDHAVVFIDDCRFSLGSMKKFPCEEDEALQYLDLSSAQVSLNVFSWALGKTSVLHSGLLAISQIVMVSGLGRAASKLYNGLCVSCRGLRAVADASANHVGHTQRIMPPGRRADGLAVMQSGLRSFSDVEGPDVKAWSRLLWTKTVESVQPESWRSTFGADACAECFAGFWTGDGERQPLETWSSKHHCRNCGLVFCDRCSQDRKCVPWEGFTHQVRVCKRCVDVVEVKNLTLQQAYAFDEQIRLMGQGLVQAVPVPKGKGKGPPLPRKGKGKGKGKEVRQEDGLGALGQEIKAEISEVKEFAVLHPALHHKQLPPRSSKQRSTGKSKEVLLLSVASYGMKQHLSEIQDALKNVTLQVANPEWFEAVEQIMPLEEKLSKDTLDRLKAWPEEEFGKLPPYEQHICQIFLAVPSLELRWRLLRLLAEPEDKFFKPLDAVSRAFSTLLLDGSPPQLWPEVKNMVGLLQGLVQPTCKTLKELADQTEVGKGRELFTKVWALREKSRVDAQNFLERLAPLLPRKDCPLQLPSLQATVDHLRSKQKELQDIDARRIMSSSSGSASSDDRPDPLKAQVQQQSGVLKQHADKLSSALEVGRSLLIALQQKGPETDRLPENWLESAEAVALAGMIDEVLQSMRTLALRLKDARPTPLAEARKGTEAEEAVPRRSSQGRGGDGCRGLGRPARERHPRSAVTKKFDVRKKEEKETSVLAMELGALPSASALPEETYTSRKTYTTPLSILKGSHQAPSEEEVLPGASSSAWDERQTVPASPQETLDHSSDETHDEEEVLPDAHSDERQTVPAGPLEVQPPVEEDEVELPSWWPR
ncbi:Vacuolar protein sorting-associated protein 27 [Durusdinium trenchii]|uniref:Vacuolar protein sorting-associated protein 27 n=1 Tax=Durusdinium trenchii TaxID=1381693 RepID=A0ABP0K049_9DINO